MNLKNSFTSFQLFTSYWRTGEVLPLPYKRIEFLPLTMKYKSLYCCNPMSWTFYFIFLTTKTFLRLDSKRRLKYKQRFTTLGFKDIGIRKFELVAKI